MALPEPDRVVTPRPLGSPTALGLFGLTAAAFTLAGLQLGWVPASEAALVGLILIGFAAPVQLLAAVLAFLARDTGTGTAMGVLALTWLSTGVVLLTSDPGSRSAVLGLLLATSAGALGLALAPLAVAVAWASGLEASGEPVLVPLGRRGEGASTVPGPLSGPALGLGLATEPGVRSLL